MSGFTVRVELPDIAKETQKMIEAQIESERHRLAHSVIETARILAECASGSRDGHSDEELGALASWLTWRTTAGWYASPGSSKDYEDAVLAMAKAALRMHREAR